MKQMNACKRLLILIGLALASMVNENAQADEERYEALYEQWHEIVGAKTSIMSESMWFSTNGPAPLADVVRQIKDNEVAFAHFLCGRIARATGPVSYSDALLLNRVAGIDLLRSDDKPVIDQNFGENLIKFTAKFREEWEQGLYEDPSERIASLCEQRLAKEGGESIIPHDVQALRRYGIFALPELVRQIKQRNSRHAFAAYLIITGQSDEYSDYLKRADMQFTTAEAKLEHVNSQFKKMEATEGAAEFDVVTKISAALGN